MRFAHLSSPFALLVALGCLTTAAAQQRPAARRGIAADFEETTPAAPLVVIEKGGEEERARYRKAAEYSRLHSGLSLLVLKNGEVVFEQYDDGFTPTTPHQLASGTKSFWGVLAAAAIEDGLFASLDEKVADTLTEWKADARKSKITVRHLLSFTSGLEPTDQLYRNFEVKDRYAHCASRRSVAEPGSVFRYSDVHLYTFGELLKRKLAARAKSEGKPADDPFTYLKRRIFDPIGLNPGRWARDAAGNPALPYGANLPAREWAKFGKLLLNGGKWEGRQVVSKAGLGACLVGSKANPAYGLSFWLNATAANDSGSPAVADGGGGRRPFRRTGRGAVAQVSVNGITPALGPKDVYMAAGAGQQRLYVLPSHGIVLVRQANKRLAGQMMRGGAASVRREMDDAVLLSCLLGADSAPTNASR